VKKEKKISNNKYKKVTTFNGLLDTKYGKRGIKKREEFEKKSATFIVAEIIKNARLNAKITQEELATRIKTKKSFISRIENGKSDIQVSTLFRLLEEGLGKKISLKIV
jgi:HTH-type transcriptional regulator / antitoxin HipB